MRLPISIIAVFYLCWASALQAAVPAPQLPTADLSESPGAESATLPAIRIPEPAAQLSLAQRQQKLKQQRRWFKQARRAISRDDAATLRRLKTKLRDYPLTPYLDIWQARRALEHGDDARVAAVLARHADIPESRNLRLAWVKRLAKHGSWQQVHGVMARFPWLAKRLPETAMAALWYSGEKQQALALFSARWQQGKRHSAFSRPIEQAWKAAGHPSIDERWQRITTLTRQRQWTRIKQLAKSFSREQKQQLKYWRAVQRHPERMLKQWPAALPAMPGLAIMRDGIRRISRRDPTAAWQLLQQLKQQLAQQEDYARAPELFELERHTALRAARRHLPAAADWLAGLPEQIQNEDTRGWRARIHILNHDWPALLAAIAAMPESEQQQSRWLYWTARAADGIGQPEAARLLYAQLAAERGYYSFLSAERIGQPFRFNAAALAAPDAAVAELERQPAVRRAHEWLQLGLRSKAARAWQQALAGGDTTQWQAAAKLASRWHWHEQLIRAAYKSDQLDAVQERFPVAYGRDVLRAARRTGLTPSAIWSIIRQESAFNRQAVSHVGAKGLMQLMPATARKVARALGIGKGAPRLFSPAVNIRLGATYLAEQKRRFGNLALAAAAYNAGPHRVSRWLKRTPFDMPEAWIEAIPFNETRRYVQQVMAFVSVYEWRQQKPATSLIAQLNEQAQKISLNEAALISPLLAKGGNH